MDLAVIKIEDSDAVIEIEDSDAEDAEDYVIEVNAVGGDAVDIAVDFRFFRRKYHQSGQHKEYRCGHPNLPGEQGQEGPGNIPFF